MNSLGRDVALSAVRSEGSQLVAARLHEALIKNVYGSAHVILNKVTAAVHY